MSANMTALENHCFDRAKRFVKNVVFFDDYAEYPDLKAEIKVAVKVQAALGAFGDEVAKGGETVAESAPASVAATNSNAGVADVESTPAVAAEAEVEGSTELDAKSLTDSFAEQGIACCVIKPSGSVDNIKALVLSVANSADILVLDWRLKDNDASITENAIKEIVANDVAMGGRLRLIGIYTSARQTEVVGRVHQLFPNLKQLDKRPVFYGSGLRIHVISKPGTTSNNRAVAPKDLPQKLLASFSEMSQGLLAAAALDAVAVVREGTHHLLSKFDGSLDGAYVAHRCLIPDPEDSELFLEELFGDQIAALMATSTVGRNINSKVVADWLTHGNKTQAVQNSINALSSKFSADKIEDIRSGHTHLLQSQNTSGVDIQKMSPKAISTLLAGHLDSVRGSTANDRLSVLSGIHRGASDILLNPNWLPRLSLGSILCEVTTGGVRAYYLCVQPLCDSVRLAHGVTAQFPFLVLSEGTSGQFDICIEGGTPQARAFKHLKVEAKPNKLTHFSFQPNAQGKSYIDASKEGGEFLFKTVDGRQLIWVAEVRQGKVQRIMSRLAERIHMLGIDEFEWMRLRLSGTD